jgi:hypothetical protein
MRTSFLGVSFNKTVAYFFFGMPVTTLRVFSHPYVFEVGTPGELHIFSFKLNFNILASMLSWGGGRGAANAS